MCKTSVTKFSPAHYPTVKDLKGIFHYTISISYFKSVANSNKLADYCSVEFVIYKYSDANDSSKKDFFKMIGKYHKPIHDFKLFICSYTSIVHSSKRNMKIKI